MAWLLVDLHRAGVYWGDCSLANTLFRRDGDKIQALPGRCGDQRDPPVAVRRAARLRSRHPRRERRLRPGRPGGHAGPRRRVRGCRGRGRDGRDPLSGGVGRAATRARAVAHRSTGHPGPDSAAQRPGLCDRRARPRAHLADVRGRPAPGGGRQPALPRPRAPEADRAGRPRRARPACSSTTSASTRPGWRHRPARRSPPRRAPTAGWPTSSSRPWPRWSRRSARCATRSRRIATSWRRSGCCPRRPATTSGWRPRWRPTWSSARRRPRPGRGLADSSIALDIDWSGGFDHDEAATPADRSRRLVRRASVHGTIRSDAHIGGVATAPVIRVRGLIKRYGEVKAVDGIDFEVAAGEVFGLLGPNGAGKTTTVEILEGLRSPDGGQATVLGVDVANGADSLKPRIGVSLQTAALYPKLTVVEVIDLFRSFYANSRPTEELIEALGLGERRNAQTRELSGGQRQRLAVALALVNDPELIFLDEPTTGPGPGGPAIALGPDPGAQGGRPHDPPDDPLHGGGGDPVRSPGDHGPRPHPRDGHRRRAHLEALQGAGGAISTASTP